MQCLFKRSSDEVLEGSPNGRFCLRFGPPPAPLPVVWRGVLGPGSTPSHSRGQAKGSRVLVLPGTMDHIKGLGGRQQLNVQGFCV